jgi:hypothetical protein
MLMFIWPLILVRNGFGAQGPKTLGLRSSPESCRGASCRRASTRKIANHEQVVRISLEHFT